MYKIYLWKKIENILKFFEKSVFSDISTSFFYFSKTT